MGRRGKVRRRRNPWRAAALEGSSRGLSIPVKPAQGAAGKNDEKAWRDKFATLRRKLEKDKADLDVMQRELGVLDVQYYPDPVKAMQQSVTRSDINDMTAKIEAKKKDIAADEQAIADAEEALRKSGGDAGWAR